MIDPHTLRPDEYVSALGEEERFLGLLDRERPVLREVALKRKKGFTKQEIASELNVSIWAVQRILQELRTIWKSHVKEHD